MKLLKKCVSCKKYTLQQDQCPYCGGNVISPHPPKFSLVKAKRYARFTLLELREQYGVHPSPVKR